MDTCEIQEGVDLKKVDPFRTIQIHPTRRCNLHCRHCYSSSAPHLTDMLDIEPLKRFLNYAFGQGFNNISISGGEPFLYSHLEELLRFTRSLGYQNTVASNGMLLQSDRNRRILDYVDLIAISLDGKKEIHDFVRGQDGAFEKMLKGVEVLKSLQKPFGFIHTVTPQSWESLLWLGEFAYGHGAKLLQLHPLEMHGRASEMLSGFALNDTLSHQTFILAHYLKSKYAGKMIVQLDLLHREYLEEFPQVVNTFMRECALKGTLPDLLDTIIIEETGRILPVAYGFAEQFTMGNVYTFHDSGFAEYIEEKIPLIRKIYDRTLNKIFQDKETDIVNWNELVVNESKAVA